jgi:hypothetical protein
MKEMTVQLNTRDHPTMGELCQLDRSGDLKTIWNPDVADEVEAARAQFTSLRAKGFHAFAVRKNGEPGSAISEFDPAAGKIIMVPQMQGG